MQTITPQSKTPKRNHLAQNKFFQLLIRQTGSDKRIALYGRDPLKR